MPVIQTRAVLMALALAVVPCWGCGGSALSKLERGGSVKSGARRFDAYFKRVATLRDEVKALDSDLFPLREPLTESMQVGVDASLFALMAETRKRATKVKNYGVALNLVLTPSPHVVKHLGELGEDAKDDRVIVAVEEAATRAMATFREYNAILDTVAKLEAEREVLAKRIDRLPTGVDRGAVKTELVGAGKVLDTSSKKLRGDLRTISHFLVALADAVDTGALPPRETLCEQAIAAMPDKPKPRRRRAGRPVRRGRRPAARPRPRPKPKPKPKPAPGGGDFEM